MADGRPLWTADQEIAALGDLLKARKLDILRTLCLIAVNDQRRWDATVSVEKVKAEARRLLETLRAVEDAA